MTFFVEGVSKGSIPTRAAAISFRLFLAFFPGIIILLSIIPLIPIDDFQVQLFDAIKSYFPGDTFSLIEDTLHDLINKKHNTLLSIGFILMVYYASDSINAILMGFNESYHLPTIHPELSTFINDGLPDTWEQQPGLDPLNATDATADGDNDGRSNLLEFQQGTDPTTYESSPTHLLLTFEGLQDNEHPEDYFAGGVGTLGSRSGPDYGITFTNPVTAAIDADAGGSGNFGGEPSPNTTLGFQTNSWMNVASGFSGGLSFYYSNPNSDSSITIYAGPNRTGAVLAVLALPRTPFNGQPDPSGTLSPFVVANVEFQGLAHSVDFSGLAFSAYLDDLKLYAIALPAGPASNLAQTVPTLPPLVMLGLAVILTALGVRQGRRQP